ncbi:MAG TPA: TIGR03560 family F420-dependent LLM class oxidoreductase [Acidimicrobiales bacterium]|nr:TIGR03560 family F420-dependent LLM class oxidoreductase [Acidimicrobiales bacterium]
MRFSIWPSANQPWSDVLATATHAEATGWDGVWIADHFMGNEGSPIPPETPTFEAGSLVAALAAAVPRVRLGTLVFGNTYRHPAVVANMAVTVDHVSGGRFTLGLGAGWQVNEHRQYGITLPPTGELIDRFEEAVQVIRSLLTQPTTTFDGQHYQLTEALCEPKSVQSPLPILIGASGEKRMLGVVARLADQWNCWGTPDLVAHKSSVLEQHCERVGRDPSEIGHSAQALVFITDDPGTAERLTAATGRATLAGSTAQLAERLHEYAEAGLDEFIVPDPTLGQGAEKLERMDQLIEEVASAVR